MIIALLLTRSLPAAFLTRFMATGETALVFTLGGHTSVGILHQTSAATIGVVFVVGGDQYRVGSHRLFVGLARSLADHGIAGLRFDHRGVGDCAAEHQPFNQLDDDIRAAVIVLKQRNPELQHIFLLGLCDGASAALISGAQMTDIDGLILINPWVKEQQAQARSELLRYYPQRVLNIEFWKRLFRGEVAVLTALRELGLRVVQAARGRSDSGDNYLEQLRQCLRDPAHKVLMILSGRDLTADQFVAFLKADPNGRTFLDSPRLQQNRIDGADHTFSQREHRELLSAAVVAWLNAQSK